LAQRYLLGGFIVKSGPPPEPMVASGDVDGTMLEALEDYVKRQKKRLGIEPNKKEAAN
jgi:hypothetical protein